MTFHSSPTDQFLVSMNVVVDGHMYRGQEALNPHTGGHVHFKNASGTWPKDGIDIPENYPPIFAVADGVVSRIDTYHIVSPPTGDHYRYGITLDIATSNVGGTYKFSYSIEPFVDPGDADFYKPYIKVSEGDVVSKGDIIAYMYLSTSDSTNPHIHFNMLHDTGGPSTFIAPIIFSDSLLNTFVTIIDASTDAFRNVDKNTSLGPSAPTTNMGTCMGYKIVAEENPFSTGAASCIR